MSGWSKIVALLAVIMAVGCEAGEGGIESKGGEYGTLYFGEEAIPVNTVKVSDSDSWLLVVLSPLEDTTLTTNAIVGLKKELLDTEVNVEYKYPNSDYIVVYEDPQCYYAPFRPLKSGTILMQQNGKSVRVEVDVILYDGMPMRYSHESLPME